MPNLVDGAKSFKYNGWVDGKLLSLRQKAKA